MSNFMIHNCCNGALEALCANSALGVASEGFQCNPHEQFLTFCRVSAHP